MIIITFGTFDLFHIGHMQILYRAKSLGTKLIVGVSSDELNTIKNKKSVNTLEERLYYVKNNIYVDEVFIEESLEKKNEYIKKYNADILVMGDDWKDKFDWVSCKVIYLDRTSNICSTDIKLNVDKNDIMIKLMKLFDINKSMYYLPTIGITNLKINSFTEYIDDYQKMFFNIINNTTLKYVVFAGSSIGLLRNSQNIPWVDDYDIIIFQDDINYFENIVIKLLIYNGFQCLKALNNGGYHILGNKKNNNYFQVDIFYTTVNENSIVKNIGNWGLYDIKNVNINQITPFINYKFNGIELPFFNKVTEDVFNEYGDIFLNTDIYINHGNDIININQHFSLVYREFENFKKQSIINTKKYLETDDKIFYENIFIENNNFIKKNNDEYCIDLSLFLIKYILDNKFESIIIDDNLIMYSCDIKFYIENIKILYYSQNFDISNIVYLNYIETLYINEIDKSKIENENIYYINKPNIISRF